MQKGENSKKYKKKIEGSEEVTQGKIISTKVSSDIPTNKSDECKDNQDLGFLLGVIDEETIP